MSAGGPSSSNGAASGIPSLTAGIAGLKTTDRGSTDTAGEGSARDAERDQARKEKAAAFREWAEVAFTEMPVFSPAPVATTNRIASNCFVLEFPNRDPTLHRYLIELDNINGRAPTKKETRRYLIEGILAAKPPTAKHFVCDYFSQIVSVGPLYGDDNTHSPYSVEHSRTAPAGQTVPPMISSIRFNDVVDKANLRKFVTPKEPPPSTDYRPDEDLKSLNLLMWGNIMKKNWQGARVGNKFFPDRANASNIPIAPEGKPKPVIYKARTGFFSSVRPGHGNLLLNINTITSAFYPVVIVQDWIFARSRTKIPNSSLRKELTGLKVTVDGDPSSMQYKIAGFSNANIDTERIQGSNNTNVTVLQDMQSRFPTLKSQPDSCCVNLGNASNLIWRPGDRLRFIDRQIVRGPLSAEFTKDMVKIATRTPGANIEAIKKTGLSPLGLGKVSHDVEVQGFMKDYGISVREEFVKFNSRKGAIPNLLFKDSTNLTPPLEAKWALKGKIFRSPASYQQLNVLHLSAPSSTAKSLDLSTVAIFLSKLQKALNQYGLGTSERSVQLANTGGGRDRIKLRQDRVKSFNQAYKKFADQRLCLVILPNKDASIYADVKWWGDCVLGVATVCITQNLISKSGSSSDELLANLCLKINAKLGGTTHSLKPATSCYGAEPGTMIMGADVSHSGQVNAPSLAGIVATCDDSSSQYLASARLQSRNTEHIDGLREMVKERLDKYFEVNNKFPLHILLYRDGVSESQYGMVIKEELPKIFEGCKDAQIAKGKQQDAKIKVTLVVVGKRHHTRFFEITALNSINHSKNLPAGTIVDNTIIAPNQFNFYLQSHASPLGTARSGHYVVLANDSGYKQATLQDVTFKICFTSARCTKSLSIVTPARYADLLCTRLRCYIKPLLDGALHQNILDANSISHHQDLWNLQGGRTNPWGPNLDNVMFYI